LFFVLDEEAAVDLIVNFVPLFPIALTLNAPQTPITTPGMTKHKMTATITLVRVVHMFVCDSGNFF